MTSIIPIRACLLLSLLFPTLWSHAQLVSVGDQGQLVYQKYANEGQEDKVVNTVPDFSMAGYRGGGVAIPTVPVKVTVDPAPGDDGERIQAAIDEVSKMEPDADGFRGAVLLAKGVYQIEGNVKIKTSGVVLRGKGASGRGTKIIATGNKERALIWVEGSGRCEEVSGSSRTIKTSYVPVGSRRLTVSSAEGYRVGDEIMVERTPNQAWLKDVDPDARNEWTTPDYTIGYERRITAIEGNTLSLDAPMVQAIEDRYGGGRVYRYSFPGRIANVGVEDLRLESEYTSDTAEDHAWKGVLLRGVEHSWVRRITAQHFVYSCVEIQSTGNGKSKHYRSDSRFITVEDCAMLDPKSKIEGGRRYSFVVQSRGGQFILFQRCYARRGRHDYVVQAQVAGPNVFLDCYAVETYSDIGPHHRYATGTLFDNILGGATRVQDRTRQSPGHGWAGAQTMFWNSESRFALSNHGEANFRIASPPGGANWGVGIVTDGQRDGNGYWESVGRPVALRSLYLAQLEARLGKEAVKAVTTPEQRRGRIWEQLADWAGGQDGYAPLFPDPNKWYRLTTKKYPDRSLHEAKEAYGTASNYTITSYYQDYSSQQWRFTPLGDGYYRITGRKHPDRALHEAQRVYKQTGNYVITTYFQDYTTQQWRLDDLGDRYYRISSKKHPDRALLESKTAYDSKSTYVATSPYRGYITQQWHLREVDDVDVPQFLDPGQWYRIISRKYPDQSLRASPRAYGEDGSYLITQEYRDRSSEQWRFVPQEDGAYRIMNKLDSERGLHEADRRYADDVSNYVVALVSKPNAAAQRWRMVPAEDGYYRLVSQRHPGRGLRPAGEEYTNQEGNPAGYYVITHPYRERTAEQWRFEAVGAIQARTTAGQSDRRAAEADSLSGASFPYPNPVRDVLHVRRPPGESEAQLEIYTLPGQRVLRQRVRASEVSIDVQALKPGTYLLRWVGQGKVIRRKFIKE